VIGVAGGQQSVTRPMTPPVTDARARRLRQHGPTVLLFLLFFGLYLGFSVRFLAASAASPVTRERGDDLFASDVRRTIRALSGLTPDPGHQRTHVHPLFAILYSPAASTLSAALGSHLVAVPLVIALVGALGVVVARLFFSSVGFEPPDALLLAAILGATAAHAFFAMIPETYAFTATSLIMLFAALAARVRNPIVLVALGVVAFGNLITSIVQVGIVYLAAACEGRRRVTARPVARAALLVAAVLVVSAGLALAQRALYPATRPFFLPEHLEGEQRYMVTIDSAAGLARRVGNLLLHMGYYGVSAPALCVADAAPPPDGRTASVQSFARVTFNPFECPPREAFSPLGGVTVVLWSALLLLALVSLGDGKRRAAMPGWLMLALGLSLAAHFALHLLYGDDLFLYTATWTFEVLALVALAIRPLIYGSPRGRPAFRVFAGAFLVLLGAHSWLYLERILAVTARAAATGA
jgi:hypothetical protein